MTTRIQTFDGNVGIGTNDPGGFKLNVFGGVKAQSLVVDGVTNSQTPIGLLGLWYGIVEEVPDGWKLCDGLSHNKSDGSGPITTPDLRDRFIRGASTTPQVGQFGGNNTVSLTEANLPPHLHPFTTQNANAPHAHGGDTGQSDANHAHGTTPVQTSHGHPGGSQANAAHAHGADSGQNSTPHSHTTGPANGTNHGHPVANSGSTHRHTFEAINANSAGKRYGGGTHMARGAPFPGILAAANAPHSHEVQNSQAPHAHEHYNSHAPHAHASGPNQNPHVHATTSGDINHPHTISSSQMSHDHGNATTQQLPHAHTEGTTGATGQGSAITITNPYYVLAYIMKI